jgi:hypothetical protein
VEGKKTGGQRLSDILLSFLGVYAFVNSEGGKRHPNTFAIQRAIFVNLFPL